MRLARILLVSALLACGSILSTEGKQAHTVQDATGGKRLLRSNDYDEERVNLAKLMKIDDQADAIKQLATDFALLKTEKKEALDVFKLMLNNQMTKKEATYISNLFAKYMENPRLYHP
ncbi:hypothetical protein P3T76_001522 [Phytophthora citrophthora]|uniref:RxLR effector protein n=1 Tax=Phytophthora citrophthora TaxID=4793 RepID=A0AAD9LUN1_9STRA|nr:hypothetical protein P3T76_001522 [Phytophthora citrophthora]